MWRTVGWKKILIENKKKKKNLPELCKIGIALWKQNKVFEKEKTCNIEKD